MDKIATEKRAIDDVGRPFPRCGAQSCSRTFLALHTARMVDWQPTAVLATSPSADGTLLAVARESGDVEIWQTAHWTLLTTLAGSRDSAVTSIAWLQEPISKTWRLFTGGLDGYLSEWDIPGRKVKHRTGAAGGAVWATAIQTCAREGQCIKLAVACDDGALRLFSVEEGEPGLLLNFSLPPLGHRLLCVAWHPNGKTVVVGTAAGSLHAWDTETHREILRFFAGNEELEREGVWAVVVLADGTIISGDGAGNVQFWDAAHASLLQTFKQHEADVLTIAALPDGQSVFASGADHQIALFGKISAPGKPHRWQYLKSKRPHTHDVKCLCIVSGLTDQQTRFHLLISGGADAQILAYNIPMFTKEHPYRITRAPEAPVIHIAARLGYGAPLLISRQHSSCHIWKLAAVEPNRWSELMANPREKQRISETPSPLHLAEVSTEEQGHITASAIAADGSILALADPGGLNLLSLKQEGEGPLTVARKILPINMGKSISALAFAESNLLVASPGGLVSVIDTRSGAMVAEIHVTACLSLKQVKPQLASSQVMSCVISGIIVSSDGKVGALLQSNATHVLNLETFQCSSSVPRHETDTPRTSAAFSPQGDVLLISLADNRLLWYNVTAQKMENLPDEVMPCLHKKLDKMAGSVTGISFLPDEQVPSANNVVVTTASSPTKALILRAVQRKAALVTTTSSACFVDFGLPARMPTRSNKVPRRLSHGQRFSEKMEEFGTNTRVIEWTDVCLACEFVDNAVAVHVERKWSEVLSYFPPPLHRNLFGT